MQSHTNTCIRMFIQQGDVMSSQQTKTVSPLTRANGGTPRHQLAVPVRHIFQKPKQVVNQKRNPAESAYKHTHIQ